MLVDEAPVLVYEAPMLVHEAPVLVDEALLLVDEAPLPSLRVFGGGGESDITPTLCIS